MQFLPFRSIRQTHGRSRVFSGCTPVGCSEAHASPSQSSRSSAPSRTPCAFPPETPHDMARLAPVHCPAANLIWRSGGAPADRAERDDGALPRGVQWHAVTKDHPLNPQMRSPVLDVLSRCLSSRCFGDSLEIIGRLIRDHWVALSGTVAAVVYADFYGRKNTGACNSNHLRMLKPTRPRSLIISAVTLLSSIALSQRTEPAH